MTQVTMTHVGWKTRKVTTHVVVIVADGLQPESCQIGGWKQLCLPAGSLLPLAAPKS